MSKLRILSVLGLGRYSRYWLEQGQYSRYRYRNQPIRSLCCTDFETLSNVHVYCIEHVSYQQGPYRIRIDAAADRIVPALLSVH